VQPPYKSWPETVCSRRSFHIVDELLLVVGLHLLLFEVGIQCLGLQLLRGRLLVALATLVLVLEDVVELGLHVRVRDGALATDGLLGR
jgi:hypothetical protein